MSPGFLKVFLLSIEVFILYFCEIKNTTDRKIFFKCLSKFSDLYILRAVFEEMPEK